MPKSLVPGAPATRRKRRIPALLLALPGVLCLASSAFAAPLSITSTLVVTNTNDTGAGSLRGVLTAAASGDTVVFDTGAFPAGQGTVIALTGPRIMINKNLTVQGPGAGAVTVSDSSDGILGVTGSNSAIITVRMSGLTLANGNGTSATSNGNGGGVYAFAANLTLTGCVFSGDKANGSGGAVSSSSGTLSLVNCTLSGNTAGVGGAVSSNGGTASLTNCTLSGNSTLAGGLGGGVYNNGTSLTLTNCTIVGNTAVGTQSSPGQGGGLYNRASAAGGTIVQSCILSGNSAATGPDASGSYTSGGSNIIGDPNGAAYGFTQTHDVVGVDPKLDPNGLKDNGGPTRTIGLLPSSPAVDGDYNGLTQTDQRGFGRPQGVRADIGAFELTAQAHILWTNPDGRATLWFINSDNSYGVIGAYGPYVDNGGVWKATAVATGPNGVSRILWNNPDGRSTLWFVNPDGSYGVTGAYGPYADNGGVWKAGAVSVGPDNVAHILWNNPDGRATLWFINSDNSYGVIGAYGPYGDKGGVWKATAVATGPNGVSRILWNNPDGRSTLWFVNPDGSYGVSGAYGPYADNGGVWKAAADSAGP